MSMWKVNMTNVNSTLDTIIALKKNIKSHVPLNYTPRHIVWLAAGTNMTVYSKYWSHDTMPLTHLHRALFVHSPHHKLPANMLR